MSIMSAAKQPLGATAIACAVTVMAASGIAGAEPVTDFDFYVANSTSYPIVLNGYATGNPYPEYVKPDRVLPDGRHEQRVEPGQKFTIGMRDEGRNTNIKINFDYVGPGDVRIPGGMVELQATIEHGADVSPGTRVHNVACWPGPDRACTPRGWSGGGNTVTFTS